MNSINITNSLLDTLNHIFAQLFASIDNKMFLYLDNLVFIDKQFFKDCVVFKILGSPYTFGLISICMSLMAGFILYYACSLLLSYLTFAQIQKPSQFIFKLILCTILIGSTQLICYFFVNATSIISLIIRTLGEEFFHINISFATLIKAFTTKFPLNPENFNLFSFEGLTRGLVSIGLINLVFSYSLRYVMIQVFCLLCPFAIGSLVIDRFSWFFKSWIKLFLSLLFLQILISVILLVVLSIDLFYNKHLVPFVFVGSIYALIRANYFIRDFMGGLSTDISLNLPSIKSIFNNH